MNCMNCSSYDTEVFIRDTAFTLIKCNDCGLIFKPDTRIEYEKLDESYYGHFNFDRSKEAQEIVHVIKKHFKNENLNLVEIGCGTGSLLNELRKYRINVFGYEPSSVACQIAEAQYHLKSIKNGYFTENSLTFVPDVFLLYDVIEHLEDALSLFQNLQKAMNQSSILIIKSGNPASFNANLYPRKWQYYHIGQHIMFYPKKALEILAARAGLKMVGYYRFRHAYGGTALKQLCKNIVKSFIFRVTTENSFFQKNRGIWLANDHFISAFKLK